MSRVFLCYRRCDSEAVVPGLIETLRPALPIEAVFLDKISLHAGDDFRTRIYQALVQADLVLVLVCDRWVESFQRRADGGGLENEDHVRVEIESALRLHKRVIPILTSKTAHLHATEMPETIRALAGLHAARYEPDCPSACAELRDIVKRALGTELDRRLESVAARIGLPSEALRVVLDGIRFAAADPASPSPLGAREIWNGVRRVVADRWGAAGADLAGRLGLKRSEDAGLIVYSLILEGILHREPTDLPSDFWGLGWIDGTSTPG